MNEGSHINKSLLALGKVINKLSEKNSDGYVSYRDSKLTRLLKDSLGGNTRTVLVTCISPMRNQWDETLNSLNYALRAKKIKQTFSQNQILPEPSTYANPETVELQMKEISRLRDELKKLKTELHKEKEARIDYEGRYIELIEGVEEERELKKVVERTETPVNDQPPAAKEDESLKQKSKEDAQKRLKEIESKRYEHVEKMKTEYHESKKISKRRDNNTDSEVYEVATQDENAETCSIQGIPLHSHRNMLVDPERVRNRFLQQQLHFESARNSGIPLTAQHRNPSTKPMKQHSFRFPLSRPPSPPTIQNHNSNILATSSTNNSTYLNHNKIKSILERVEISLNDRKALNPSSSVEEKKPLFSNMLVKDCKKFDMNNLGNSIQISGIRTSQDKVPVSDKENINSRDSRNNSRGIIKPSKPVNKRDGISVERGRGLSQNTMRNSSLNNKSAREFSQCNSINNENDKENLIGAGSSIHSNNHNVPTQPAPQNRLPQARERLREFKRKLGEISNKSDLAGTSSELDEIIKESTKVKHLLTEEETEAVSKLRALALSNGSHHITHGLIKDSAGCQLASRSVNQDECDKFMKSKLANQDLSQFLSLKSQTNMSFMHNTNPSSYLCDNSKAESKTDQMISKISRLLN